MEMLILPAIDLLKGKAVRLKQGDMDDFTVYYDNPLDAAKMFADMGVKRLHIVNEEAQGVWDCVKCMECAEVCPKEVNPIEKITKLHNMVFEAGIAKNNVATRHAVGFAHSIEKHGLLDEGELVRYSEGNIGVLKHVPVALKMFAKGKIVLPWNMPKADKLDEIQKLIKISSTAKF